MTESPRHRAITGPAELLPPTAAGAAALAAAQALAKKATAAAACPSLGAKKVSPRVLRHSTAMHLFQAGVDTAVIALWLGHESLETTHVYVEADLATKERALEKMAPMPGMPACYRADDKLLAFLTAL
jgi:integrase/recombinase XerD